MKERPMLFNSDMVNAIIDGRKTQTRRPLKKQYPNIIGDILLRDVWYGCESNVYSPENKIYCPFGQVGDRIWVRETFGFGTQDDDVNHIERVVCYKAGYPYHITDTGVDQLKKCKSGELMQPNHYVWEPEKWTPSIHMPRWASRITLEITDVRVQRVQNITEEQAKAEGVKPDRFIGEGRIGETSYREGFAGIWTDIYGTWDSNVWVWAIIFKRIK